MKNRLNSVNYDQSLDRYKAKIDMNKVYSLTISWLRYLTYTNQSIDLVHKSMDWFLYDSVLRH